jgi:hypothetical protein
MTVEVCDLSGFIVNRSLPACALAVTLKALILAQLGSIDECRVALDESEESFARLEIDAGCEVFSVPLDTSQGPPPSQ